MCWVRAGSSAAAVLALAIAVGAEDIPSALETGDATALDAAVRQDPRAAAAWFAGAWLAWIRARAEGAGADEAASRLDRVASAFERVLASGAPRTRLRRAIDWSGPSLAEAIAVADAWTQGREAFGRGEIDAAEKAWREAAAGAARLGDAGEAGRIRHALAALLKRAGRSRDAAAFAEQAASAFRDEGDPIGLADALSMLAGLAGDEGRARDLLRDAAEIYETIGDRIRAGLARFNRGVSFRDGGSPDEARTAFEAAAGLLAKTKYEALAWKNLGSARAACGDPARAD
ncbi:MAG: hypothetical protein JXP34_01675, partial [Planctomycetes bacterium]|nr:hypothetical protein [Planctomycetota bacterium]